MEVVVSKHYAMTTTSAQSHTLYLEVVVADLSESTTTSKRPHPSASVEEGVSRLFPSSSEN
jgi:hypothetical protein